MSDINTPRLDVLIRKRFMSDNTIHKLFQERTTLLDMINNEDPELIDSLGCEFTLNLEPAGPNTYTGESADFPDSQPLLDSKGRIRYVRLQRSMTMTIDSYLHFTKLSDQQILEKLAGRIDRDMATAKKDHNQMMYGTSSGEVARVIAPLPAGGTITNATVAFSQNVAGGNTFGTFKVRKNAPYEWRDASGNQVVGTDNITVSICKSKNTKAGTAVFDKIPSSSGSHILTAGMRLVPSGSYGNCPYGLQYFFAASGVVQNLSMDTYEAYRANILPAGNQYLGAPILTKLKNAMSYRVDPEDMENLNILYAPAQDHALNMQGQSIRRATMGDRTYDGSYKDVAFEGTKPTACPDCPRDMVFRWAKGKIKRVELYPYDIFEVEGRTVHLSWNNGKAHGGRLLMYFLWMGNNYCPEINQLAGISGLALAGLPLGYDV